MPQWIGKILNDSGVGSIDMPDMITELKQALSKEKWLEVSIIHFRTSLLH